MRVLHVIPSIAVADGGPTQSVLGMCRGLRAAGVAAEIATTRGFESAAEEPPVVSPELPVWEFPRTCSRAWKYSRSLGAWLRRHASDYDVIHAHAVFTYSTRAACRAAAWGRVPVVLTTHGMLSPCCRGQKPVRKWCYWHLVEKRNLRSVACLLATAPAEADELRQMLPDRRVEWISLGLDEAAWQMPRREGEFRRQHGIPPNCPLVLHLARLHSIKGLADVLLPALAAVPDAHLAVVGAVDPSEPHYAAHVRTVVDRLGLASRVTFTGAIYGDDRWAAYDAADLYVLPSMHENFGITVIEAMARGIPCLVSLGVKSSLFIEQARAGKVVERTPAALAAAMSELLAVPPAQRAAMGGRARELVKHELSWKHVAGRMVELYESIVAPASVSACASEGDRR
jgi:glycosyltransferase involved in cell wall biosynthesis